MADEFEVEEQTPSFISVRHLGEGHHYSFDIAELPKGRRVVSGVAMRDGNLGKHTADYFKSSAHAFAEREARKAGLID